MSTICKLWRNSNIISFLVENVEIATDVINPLCYSVNHCNIIILRMINSEEWGPPKCTWMESNNPHFCCLYHRGTHPWYRSWLFRKSSFMSRDILNLSKLVKYNFRLEQVRLCLLKVYLILIILPLYLGYLSAMNTIQPLYSCVRFCNKENFLKSFWFNID